MREINPTTREELRLLLDSSTGRLLCSLLQDSVEGMRRDLLSSLNLSAEARHEYVVRIHQTYAIIKRLYDTAGQEVPAAVASYFQGKV